MNKSRITYGIRRCGQNYEKALKRDKYVCAICGASYYIIVHHLDGNTQHNTLDNLLSVCKHCHAELHGYTLYFKQHTIEKIKKLRGQFKTYQEIGDYLGISRQRVHQIINRAEEVGIEISREKILPFYWKYSPKGNFLCLAKKLTKTSGVCNNRSYMEETYLDKKNRVRENLKAEMKIAYLQGVPSNVIAKKHNISIKTFYKWMSPSKEEKVEHYKRLLSINEAVAEEIVEETSQSEVPNEEIKPEENQEVA